MARPLRILERDGIYNVGSRGNNKETMFRDATDWLEFLRLLAKVATRHSWEGWAYCLMGNHFHLVVQLPYLGLSEGMQVLNSGYAIRTNSRYKRSGHLVRNRFYSQQRDAPAGALPIRRAQPGSRRPLQIAGRLAVEQLSSHSRTRATPSLSTNPRTPRPVRRRTIERAAELSRLRPEGLRDSAPTRAAGLPG